MQIYYDTNGHTYAYTYHLGARAYLTKLNKNSSQAYFSFCRDRALPFPNKEVAQALVLLQRSR